jgi:hypothetical protein
MLTITLDEKEQRALMALLDAAMKASGIQALDAVNVIVAKLRQAQAEANKPRAVENEAEAA